MERGKNETGKLIDIEKEVKEAIDTITRPKSKHAKNPPESSDEAADIVWAKVLPNGKWRKYRYKSGVNKDINDLIFIEDGFGT